MLGEGLGAGVLQIGWGKSLLRNDIPDTWRRDIVDPVGKSVQAKRAHTKDPERGRS